MRTNSAVQMKKIMFLIHKTFVPVRLQTSVRVDQNVCAGPLHTDCYKSPNEIIVTALIYLIIHSCNRTL